MKPRSRRTSSRKKKPIKVPARHHKLGDAELSSAQKQFEAAESNTSKEALIEKYGRDRYQEHPDGSWTIRLDNWREVDEFDEMDRPRQRLEVESARQSLAGIERATLVDPEGRAHEVDADHAEYAATMAERNGVHLREKMRYRPTSRYVATVDGLVRVR